MSLDARVERALTRWPDVPAAYGWLSLDTRGRWRLDGGLVRNLATCEAISRNYVADESGCWYYQNGPQKAFVTLQYTPWVYVLDGHRQLCTHTGRSAQTLIGAWMDEDFALLLLTEHGIGVVSDIDVEVLLDCFCDVNGKLLDSEQVERYLTECEMRHAPLYLNWGRVVPIGKITRANVAAQFTYNPQPGA